MPKLTKTHGQLRWLWVAAVAFAIDFISKIIALQHLQFQTPIEIFPFLNLTLTYNYGAAFSFLAAQSGWQLWFFTIIAIIVIIAILYWLRKIPRRHNLFAISLTFILGGAIGNVFDRIFYGYVIDFIDFHYKAYHWPTFNLADSFICIGAFLFILSSLKHNKSN